MNVAPLNPDLLEILNALEEMGASVRYGERPFGEEEIAAVEEELGISLPEEYREFLQTFGQIEIELHRTWIFYGLTDGLDTTRFYQEEFHGAIAAGILPSPTGPYYPQRFFVLYDEGEYSNAASGTVWDHDLDAFLVTDGARWVEASDAFQMGYFGYLIDELLEIQDRIAEE